LMNPTIGWFSLRPCSVLCILPLARSLLCCGGALVRTFTLVALHSAAHPAGSLQRRRIWNLEGAGAGVPWGVEIDPRACAAGRGGVWFLWFGLWHGARPFRRGVGERPQGKGERGTIGVLGGPHGARARGSAWRRRGRAGSCAPAASHGVQRRCRCGPVALPWSIRVGG
jgi:hypothetical protein